MHLSPADDVGPKKARIEIIPLIDVIFFLLATFVLFTLSLDKIKAIDVTLPVGIDGPPGPDETLFIQTSEHGTYYWKIGAKTPPEAITAAELGPRLEDYKRGFATPRVLVRGDGKAKLGAAIYALDEVRKAGIKEVSVETVPSNTGN
jgi:biopolymer transport protein ExbD